MNRKWNSEKQEPRGKANRYRALPLLAIMFAAGFICTDVALSIHAHSQTFVYYHDDAVARLGECGLDVSDPGWPLLKEELDICRDRFLVIATKTADRIVLTAAMIGAIAFACLCVSWLRNRRRQCHRPDQHPASNPD